MAETNKHWLDFLVHLRQASYDLSTIIKSSDGEEKAIAEMAIESISDPWSRAWRIVRENCTLEEIAARNL